MATMCEQVDSYGNVVNDYDSKFDAKTILFEFLTEFYKQDKKVQVYKEKKFIRMNNNGKEFIFFAAQISYLGNSPTEDRSFKKRIQIPSYWRDLTKNFEDEVTVMWLGIYLFQENLIISDFIKDSYMLEKNKLNNSSAHIYINDLYQAMNNRYFKRIDTKGNTIYSIRSVYFHDYLFQSRYEEEQGNRLFEALDQINSKFPFKKNLFGHECYGEMHKNDYVNTIQTKWNGFYLEFIFDRLLKECNIDVDLLSFVIDGKMDRNIDLDLYSKEYDFFSDLKASNIDKLETPGNDKESIISALEKHKKLWYIIYQHESELDKNISGETFKAWESIRKERGKVKPTSGKQKNQMVGKIRFINMLVLEVNRANCRDVLKDFNQGVNSNGQKRKAKFSIDKRNIENFVIYRCNI